MLNRLSIWKRVAAFHRFLFRIGLGRPLGGFLLLLYVRGRKSGHLYEIPVMYDLVDDRYVIASARGLQADWLKNLQANPNAEINVKGERIAVTAEIVSDLDTVVAFLLSRRQKRPLLGLVMRLEGLPRRSSPADYEAYAANRALVILSPLKEPS